LEEQKEDDDIKENMDDRKTTVFQSKLPGQDNHLDKKNAKKVIKLNMFGYLDVNKDEGILSDFGWDKKYVILRKDRIYYYKSRDAEKADGNFVIKDIATCDPHEKDKLQWLLKFKETQKQKDVRFKLQSGATAIELEERHMWIEAIRYYMKGEPTESQEIETDEIFYPDTTPLFQLEEQPNLAFNFVILKKTKRDKLRVESIIAHPEAKDPLKMSIAARNKKNEGGCCPCLKRKQNPGDYQKMVL